MFEDEQSALAQLLCSNTNFRELYDHHESLGQAIQDDVNHVHPLGDNTLTQLKRRKLFLKDQMANMIHSYHMAES